MLKYPKVYDAMSNIMQNCGLLEGKIVVSEKYDGSQFRIEVDREGTIRVGSKKVDELAIIEGDELTILKEQKMFLTAIQRVYELRENIRKTLNKYFFNKEPLLTEVYLFAEYLERQKHNVLVYGRVPKNNLVLFDIILVSNGMVRKVEKDDDGVWYKHKVADEIGIEKEWIMYEGEWKEGMLKEFLNKESSLGKEKVEGIIIKNYNKTYPVDMLSTKSYFGFHLVGKWVREDFKEKLNKEWNVKKKMESMQGIIEALLTEARLNKAIQHLKEEGKIQNEKRDLAHLIPEFIEDIIDEERQWIEKQLWKVFEREFRLKAQRFVVKKYLERLEKSI